jgi:hypothetical protein
MPELPIVGTLAEWIFQPLEINGLRRKNVYVPVWPAVPEPGTLALLVLGASGLAALRRRES